MDESIKYHITQEINAAVDGIESKINLRESRRFRNMYLIVGFVSFIGIGVLTQLVDFYATKAIENKLTEAKQELDSAKTFAKLMALATSLDISESFTKTERDTALNLLVTVSNNESVRAEPAFVLLLEKIVDSFAASNNPMQITRIFNLYEDECLTNEGIALTLAQHFAREYLASVDPDSSVSTVDYASLQKIINALKSHNAAGIAYAFQVLGEYKKSEDSSEESIHITLDSLRALDKESLLRFLRVVHAMSDPHEMGSKPGPELMRIADVVKAFREKYFSELEGLESLGRQYVGFAG